tara:strand:+ start:12548 stop:13288 length:741 start_codon:yes stop_codon:yes gene_type:complete
MALFLISIGLSDKKDMSLKAIETIKKCNKLYIERYTNYYKTSNKELSEFLKKEVIELKRNDIENNSNKIIKEAKNKKIGILIPGDALSATTHSSLILESKEKKIKTNIIHGSSILTSVGETGLSLYKFGKTASIPFDNEKIETPYQILKENKNSHTLFLLDIKDKKYMNIKEALSYLLSLEKKKKNNLINEDTLCVACCALGSNEQEIKSGKVKEILKINFKKYPQCLIIPTKLHFYEEEMLNCFK